MKRIFISLPYTTSNPLLKVLRVECAKTYFVRLLQEGFCPVSPIVTGHQLVEELGVDNSFTFWNDYCSSELQHCDELHVLMLGGWDKSDGIAAEIIMAIERDIIVKYIPQSEIKGE